MSTKDKTHKPKPIEVHTVDETTTPEDERNSLAQKALSVVLFVPRKGRRAFSRTKTRLSEVNWVSLAKTLAVLALCVLVCAASAYVTYVLMAAIYSISHVAFWLFVGYYSLMATFGIGAYFWLARSMKEDEEALEDIISGHVATTVAPAF